MFFSNLKISAKLLILNGMFLIPITAMLIFIWSDAAGTIRKNKVEHDGLVSLKPAVTVIRNLPQYLNVYLGLTQGDLRQIDNQISGALRSLDRDMRRFSADGRDLQDLSSIWETLKTAEKNDEELYQKYIEFFNFIRNIITGIGEDSALILVSDMNAYYFVSPVISIIPEAAERLFTISNFTRKSLYEARDIVIRWNSDLALAQEQGRRLTARPYDRSPDEIPMSMIAMAELQQIRNSNLFIVSDRDRLSAVLRSAVEESNRIADEFIELESSLERYMQSVDDLSGDFRRIAGFNLQNPATVREFMDTVSHLYADLCDLWEEVLASLDAMILQNTQTAQRHLILYIALVLISVGIAIFFVLLITADINRSVSSLKTLFRGLNKNDLTLTLQVRTKDEFGEMMSSFNIFLDLLRRTFGSFKKSTQMVASSVFDISSSSKEITTTANEQSASVSEIVSTMESSKNLSEQIAIKTSEVANLTKETQNLSCKGAELREANQTMMEDIRNQNQKIINEIKNLSDMIIRISEAIRIIDGIADQTKLIAFNASLEASSSGEAGARFSVVASEIRRFADNVVESTKEIKQKIEEVQGASQILITEANSGSKQIELGYERMGEQKTVFENIVENSQNVAVRSQQISNLSKQQELASSQIFTALKEISAGVKQFVIATSSTSKIADNLNDMSDELKGIVDKYHTEN